MRAHWRHLANTIEPVLPSAHPSPQSKRQIDRFGCSCTAQAEVPILTMGSSCPQNCPFRWGISVPPSNTWFPEPTRVLKPNGTSIGSAGFAGLTSVTDQATRSVTINRIYVRSTDDAA